MTVDWVSELTRDNVSLIVAYSRLLNFDDAVIADIGTASDILSSGNVVCYLIQTRGELESGVCTYNCVRARV